MGIGENIRRLRELHGLTQEELGKVAGVSSMAVSQWENGRAVPRMGAVQRLADRFGITKGELIDEADGGCATQEGRTSEENELLSLYRSTDSRGRAAIMAVARSQGGANNS